MKARIGSNEIIDSGTIVAPADDTITIEIGGTDPLIYKFEFQNEKGDASSYKFTTEGGNQLNIIVINTESPIGASTPHPLEVGTLGNNPERRLYLSFALYVIEGDKKTRVLHYTFTLGEAVKHS